MTFFTFVQIVSDKIETIFSKSEAKHSNFLKSKENLVKKPDRQPRPIIQKFDRYINTIKILN